MSPSSDPSQRIFETNFCKLGLLLLFLTAIGIKEIYFPLLVLIYCSILKARKMGSLFNDDPPDVKMSKHWHETFDQIFKDFSPDQWSLKPTEAPMPQGWRSFKDSAKVKFLCECCGNSWTSMRGVVIFWFNKISDKPEVKEKKDQGECRDSEAGASRCENGNVCMYLQLIYSPLILSWLILKPVV